LSGIWSEVFFHHLPDNIKTYSHEYQNFQEAKTEKIRLVRTYTCFLSPCPNNSVHTGHVLEQSLVPQLLTLLGTKAGLKSASFDMIVGHNCNSDLYLWVGARRYLRSTIKIKNGIFILYCSHLIVLLNDTLCDFIVPYSITHFLMFLWKWKHRIILVSRKFLRNWDNKAVAALPHGEAATLNYNYAVLTSSRTKCATYSNKKNVSLPCFPQPHCRSTAAVNKKLLLYLKILLTPRGVGKEQPQATILTDALLRLFIVKT